MSTPNKRWDRDVMKLIKNGYRVEQPEPDDPEIWVEFHGPPDSLYEGGVWDVSAAPEPSYPDTSPFIRFENRIYHPNIHDTHGDVCLHVIGDGWKPEFDLVTVFQEFLPSILIAPDEESPINVLASMNLHCDPGKKYDQYVREHCAKYAKSYASAIRNAATASVHNDDGVDVKDGRRSEDEVDVKDTSG